MNYIEASLKHFFSLIKKSIILLCIIYAHFLNDANARLFCAPCIVWLLPVMSVYRNNLYVY